MVALDDDGTAALALDRGWAVRTRDKLALTPAGRAEADARFRVPDSDAARARLTEVKGPFDQLNHRFLRLCHDWQVRAGNVVNDHRDTEYDWSVIDRLVTFDSEASHLLRNLGASLERLVPYRDRLRAARRRVVDGEPEWFASPRIDSYHTVWMQLHEDLLLALGLERGKEPTDA